MALRKCKHCGLKANSVEELQLFKYNRTSKHNRELMCKRCNASKNAGKYFNITPDEYLEVLKDSKCFLCGTKDKLCYDHDHTTGEFRGILCQTHNRALGMLGDSKESLLKMIEYLDG